MGIVVLHLVITDIVGTEGQVIFQSVRVCGEQAPKMQTLRGRCN